jgi:hypothetical protein
MVVVERIGGRILLEDDDDDDDADADDMEEDDLVDDDEDDDCDAVQRDVVSRLVFCHSCRPCPCRCRCCSCGGRRRRWWCCSCSCGGRRSRFWTKKNVSAAALAAVVTEDNVTMVQKSGDQYSLHSFYSHSSLWRLVIMAENRLLQASDCSLLDPTASRLAY